MAETAKPGFYPGRSADWYFSDPCPLPSLSSSIAKMLLERSPRHAWLSHPRLNPDFEPDADDKYTLGSVAHNLLLGVGKEFAVFDFPDWRTKDAKMAKIEATADNRVAILKKDFEVAEAMVEAAKNQLAEIDATHGFLSIGSGELIAVASEGNIHLRTMIDWAVDARRLFDFKTTAMRAHPDRIPAIMADAGWHIQAAFQERILDAIDPEGAGRRAFHFVCQENKPPFALTVSELPESTMEAGRRQVAKAVAIWSRCMADNRWPMYGNHVLMPVLPPWALAQQTRPDDDEEGGE